MIITTQRKHQAFVAASPLAWGPAQAPTAAVFSPLLLLLRHRCCYYFIICFTAVFQVDTSHNFSMRALWGGARAPARGHPPIPAGPAGRMDRSGPPRLWYANPVYFGALCTPINAPYKYVFKTVPFPVSSREHTINIIVQYPGT